MIIHTRVTLLTTIHIQRWTDDPFPIKCHCVLKESYYSKSKIGNMDYKHTSISTPKRPSQVKERNGIAALMNVIDSVSENNGAMIKKKKAGDQTQQGSHHDEASDGSCHDLCHGFTVPCLVMVVTMIHCHTEIVIRIHCQTGIITMKRCHTGIVIKIYCHREIVI